MLTGSVDSPHSIVASAGTASAGAVDRYRRESGVFGALIAMEQPDTIATAIRIGNPVNKERALKARAESNGDFMAVTDAEIIEAYKLLGSGEGVFCEPASAASVASARGARASLPHALGTEESWLS